MNGPGAGTATSAPHWPGSTWRARTAASAHGERRLQVAEPARRKTERCVPGVPKRGVRLAQRSVPGEGDGRKGEGVAGGGVLNHGHARAESRLSEATRARRGGGGCGARAPLRKGPGPGGDASSEIAAILMRGDRQPLGGTKTFLYRGRHVAPPRTGADSVIPRTTRRPADVVKRARRACAAAARAAPAAATSRPGAAPPPRPAAALPRSRPPPTS